MARPIKCTTDMMMRCCAFRSQGMDRTAISKELGIDRRTLYRWIKQGEKARVGKFKRFHDKWIEAEEKYLLINPPKNTYKKKYARETFAGYHKFRKEVLARDGYSCVCCGYDDDLEVHHINGVYDNPEMATDVNNGVTLCKYCHLKYHHIYSRYGVNETDFMEFMDRFKVKV